MKVKVLKEFKDKYTGKIHKAGEVMMVTADRYNEIRKKGELVEEIKEPAKAKKTAE